MEDRKILYFIESIQSNKQEDGPNKYSIVMEDVEESRERSYFRMIERESIPKPSDSAYPVYEGQYVYYSPQTDNFSLAYNNEMARIRQRDNLKYRRHLISYQLAHQIDGGKEDSAILSDVEDVTSYHINVGHGNCTIMLLRGRKTYQLWMVDCGGMDMLNRRCYFTNIQTCLDEIARILNVQSTELEISRFFLTHWHYDHISGINFLIENGYITNNTVFYMNLYYPHSSKCANDLLKRLDDMHVLCYEPISSMRKAPALTILYPERRIRKWHSVKDPNCGLVMDMNNTSVVYSFDICGRIMVFPGDLEKAGWDTMTLSKSCQQKPLCYTDYYCISHHGSTNGHVDIPCLGKSCYSRVGECLSSCLLKAVLMGRNGAYSGIYSPIVINYFGNTLRYSEKDGVFQSCKAYVLDWCGNSERYVY